jgi:very-short-patch-repair endonuclease
MVRSKKLDYTEIRKHVRELRHSMTESEKQLWKEIRNRKLSGFKFLRQHPIIYKGDLKRLNYFVADFYCDEKKVVIELDGMIHELNLEYDAFRDSEIENLGIHVIRIKNEELINMKKVLDKIESFLHSII